MQNKALLMYSIQQLPNVERHLMSICNGPLMRQMHIEAVTRLGFSRVDKAACVSSTHTENVCPAFRAICKCMFSHLSHIMIMIIDQCVFATSRSTSSNGWTHLYITHACVYTAALYTATTASQFPLCVLKKKPRQIAFQANNVELETSS